MTTTTSTETENDQASSKKKCSILFTTSLKLLFSILFTVGTVYQHPNLNDTLGNMCRKCDFWNCFTDNEIQECMKDYKFGFLIGGAILFSLSIIIETFWVNYILYLKANLMKNVMCGVYTIGTIIIMVAAIMEIELDKIRGYYDKTDFRNMEPGLWITGGIVCFISQIYWAWILKSGNMLAMFAYIPAIVASVLWMVARGVLGIDYVIERSIIVYGTEDYEQLQADLMISASVLYIFHALFWSGAIYGTASSNDFVPVDEENSGNV